MRRGLMNLHYVWEHSSASVGPGATAPRRATGKSRETLDAKITFEAPDLLDPNALFRKVVPAGIPQLASTLTRMGRYLSTLLRGPVGFCPSRRTALIPASRRSTPLRERTAAVRHYTRSRRVYVWPRRGQFQSGRDGNMALGSPRSDRWQLARPIAVVRQNSARQLCQRDVTLLHPDQLKLKGAGFPSLGMLLIAKGFRPDDILANDRSTCTTIMRTGRISGSRRTRPRAGQSRSALRLQAGFNPFPDSADCTTVTRWLRK